MLPNHFDQAGVIDAYYALPADGLGIRDVRRRLYRGRCRHNEQLDDTIAPFNERRAGLQAALVPELLAERHMTAAKRHLDELFVTINDPQN